MSLLFNRLDRWADGWYRAVKLPLLAQVSGRVLEIGAGTGVNFPYYPAGTDVTCVEPNPWLHERLQQRASDCGFHPTLVASGAECLPFPNESFDAVVGTLVLCSVRHVAQVIGELERVLKPGGVYFFVEHVRGRGVCCGYQRLLRFPWQFLFGNCHLTRDPARTWGERPGWIVQAESIPLGPRWLPIRPHLVGQARWQPKSITPQA